MYLRSLTVITLVRFSAHVSLEMLVERALIAEDFLADGTDVGAFLAFVDLLVTLEAVVGGEGGAALAHKLLEALVQFDVVLQRQDRLHLLAAQFANEVALAGVHRVAVCQLFGAAGEPLRAVLAAVRQRIVVGRVPLLVVLQVVLVLETHAAQLARVLEQFLLVAVHLALVRRHVLGRVELLAAQVALKLALVRVRVQVVHEARVLREHFAAMLARILHLTIISQRFNHNKQIIMAMTI